MPRLNTNRIKDSTKHQVRILGVQFFWGKRKEIRYFICTMPQIHFDFEKILHNRKSTVSLMAEFTKTLKMWSGLRIASGSKCRIKILHEHGTFMYKNIFCASSVDICIEFFCYEYLWDLKLSLVYMHNAGLMSRQTTEQRGNSLFKPPIYWGRPTFNFIVMKLGKCKPRRSTSKNWQNAKTFKWDPWQIEW